MGEIKKQKRNSKNSKGSGFGRWDAFVANFFAEHPEYRNGNTPPAIGKKRKRK